MYDFHYGEKPVPFLHWFCSTCALTKTFDRCQSYRALFDQNSYMLLSLLITYYLRMDYAFTVMIKSI